MFDKDQDWSGTLTKMMTAAIKDFESKNKIVPKRVLIFKSGTSFGDMQMMMNTDMAEVKKVCDEMKVQDMAMVMVNKRGKVRVFEEFGGERYSNPKNGTLIDSGIT